MTILPTTRRLATSVLPVLAGVSLLAACQEINFEEFDEIVKLRVIGIVADPPEIGPGQTATIRAILARPLDQSGALLPTWEVCGFTQGPDARYACAEVDGQPLGFELGEAEEVTIAYDTVAALGFDVDTICDALRDVELPDFIELPSCLRGIDVTVRMTLPREDQIPLVAIRRLQLLRPEEATRDDVNRNPLLQGMTVNGRLLEPGVPLEVPFPANANLLFQALINVEDDAQTYAPPDPNTPGARLEERREQLQLNWFSTVGEFDLRDTFFREGIAPATELQSNRLELDVRTKARVGDTVGVWVVLLDDRGGQSGAHYQVRLTAP